MAHSPLGFGTELTKYIRMLIGEAFKIDPVSVVFLQILIETKWTQRNYKQIILIKHSNSGSDQTALSELDFPVLHHDQFSFQFFFFG